MAKITAIYCRVSTTHQKLDSQEDELQRWLDLHNPSNVRWFKDKFTGKTMHRANMQKMLELMHQGKVDTIVVWRLDRLGRTASGLTKLFDELRRNKCNLISIRDHLDLSTPAGRLNANIIASVAAYETEVRGERVRAGQEAARARQENSSCLQRLSKSGNSGIQIKLRRLRWLWHNKKEKFNGLIS